MSLKNLFSCIFILSNSSLPTHELLTCNVYSKVLKGAYWISSNSSFIQYCDSNIGLFSFAPPLVMALPTLR